ncbi:hypothetical protein BD324DRAFT_490775 [Kockovaella imperatae]|uniref:Uncharacterized protein n=1 Tax=Kockovaella imperatae TaxID=4999 RepID=A0A1Y1UFR7_9TREE|nr:hypothetical protein BD324DRAFT_490775 [Kockovaella imperatae]ORX36356.1 hypothetical protein BD324DRAFT_490775 [Kockovaella imperatae]
MSARQVLKYYTHHPSFWENLKFLTHLGEVLHGEPPSQYIRTTFEIIDLIREIDPDICVLDPLFDVGTDAVKYLDRKAVILHPMNAQMSIMDAQGLGMLNFPPVGSGFRYPMTILDKLRTLITTVWSVVWFFFLDPKFRAINKARKAVGLKGPLGFLAPVKGRLLCMSSDPILEYPAIMPDHVSSCGPIILPNLSVKEADPELAEWLSKGPIILIVLGSHMRMTQEGVGVFGDTLEVVLRQRPDLRVLWKVQAIGNVDLGVLNGVVEDKTRIKIVSWLKPMPIALLQSGNVAVFVNHGGSNSYHEGLATGTPQIILSPWADCHDCGHVVEWLGLGAWGNRNAGPSFETQELIRAFESVLGSSSTDSRALKVKARAMECKRMVDDHWAKLAKGRQGNDGRRLEGRDLAAIEILGLARENEVKTS